MSTRAERQVSSADHGRRTKIIGTIGPATASEARLRGLIEAGMNVARLNFSHGERAAHGVVLARIRELAGRLDLPVAILQDLAGPKVRVGELAGGGVTLEAGQPFVLTTRPIEGSPGRVSVSYAGLPGEVEPGSALLLADGAIELRVERVTREDVECRVVVGGHLGSRKGVNVPSGLPGLPILGPKDLEDLRFGLGQGVDYVGLSFVRSADDVRAARARIEELGADTPVIAKIETQAALDRIDEILETADGIMIARGDLSIETPFARVPVVQKRLIAQANRRAKPVITATQMLFSMVSSSNPTRAEVADVANAVLDGSDAVMLSEETAIGEHPVRALEVMAMIARETERGALAGARLAAPGSELPGPEALAIVEAACQVAARLQADVIVTLTEDGQTARSVASFRPAQPILALTSREATYRRLALVRGVVPLRLPEAPDDRDAFTLAREAARAHGWEGKHAVLVSRDLVRQGPL